MQQSQPLCVHVHPRAALSYLQKNVCRSTRIPAAVPATTPPSKTTLQMLSKWPSAWRKALMLCDARLRVTAGVTKTGQFVKDDWDQSEEQNSVTSNNVCLGGRNVWFHSFCSYQCSEVIAPQSKCMQGANCGGYADSHWVSLVLLSDSIHWAPLAQEEQALPICEFHFFSYILVTHGCLWNCLLNDFKTVRDSFQKSGYALFPYSAFSDLPYGYIDVAPPCMLQWSPLTIWWYWCPLCLQLSQNCGFKVARSSVDSTNEAGQWVHTRFFDDLDEVRPGRCNHTINKYTTCMQRFYRKTAHCGSLEELKVVKHLNRMCRVGLNLGNCRYLMQVPSATYFIMVHVLTDDKTVCGWTSTENVSTHVRCTCCSSPY